MGCGGICCGVKWGQFKGAQGAVPDQRFAGIKDRIDRGHGCRTCIQDHRISGAVCGGNGFVCGIRGEFTRHNHIGR